MEAKQREPLSPKEGYVFVANLEDIPQGKGRVFKIQGKSLAVFRIDDRCFAINDICLIRGLHWAKVDSKVLSFLVHGIISNLTFGQDLGQMGEAIVS